MARELLLELVGVDIELLYHFVDVVDVILQVVLRILYTLVPQHRQVALDVSLGNGGVGEHLEIGSAHLSGQHEGLALHQSIFLR